MRLLLLSVVAAVAFPTIVRGQVPQGAGMTVERVMETIQELTGCFFAFDPRAFDVTRVVQAPRAGAGVEELLELITADTGFAWLSGGAYIVIHFAPRPAPTAPAPPRTSDTYTPSDPLADAFGAREVLVDPAPQPVTVSPAPPEAIPAPWSVYRNPDTFTPIRLALPRWAIKTDLLYGAATLTPNIGVEWGLDLRSSVELTWGWNQLGHEGTRKLNHGLGRIEYRRWLCERYNGHFVGANVFGAKYNVGGRDVPTLFERRYRYEGWAWGAGVTWGYHLALSRRWGVEFQVGLGAARYSHTRFECVRCGTELDRPRGVWFGPTRAGIDIVFMLGR